MTIPATRRRENTRARLLEAAAQLFAEVGLEGASVEAICERAGFTRGAFYSNFGSKNELFLALTVSLADEQLTRVRARVDELTATGALQQMDDIYTLMQHVLEVAGEDRDDILLSSEIYLQALRDPEFGAIFLKQQQRLFASIEEIIEVIVSTGVFTLRTSTSAAATMLMSVRAGATMRAAISKDGADLMEEADRALGELVVLLVEERGPAAAESAVRADT